MVAMFKSAGKTRSACAMPLALALLLPHRWLVVALVTWGLVKLFAFVSRRQRGHTTTVPPVALPSTAPLASPPKWQARHIGFAHDGLILDGLDVWATQWRRLGGESLQLPHPAYPQQRHYFDIYEAGEGPQTRQFAAGELSNGVWGFYARESADGQQTGTSTDGTLGFGNRLNPSGALKARIGRIWRMSTGKVLADGAGWTSSQVIPEAEGTLLYALHFNGNDALFRLHPPSDSFGIVGENSPTAPLGRLAETVGAALRQSIERTKNCRGVRLAPDGTIRVEFAAVEWSNSHWVDSPRVLEVATGRILLDLWDTDWDAAVSFPGTRRADLDMRRYHGAGRYWIGIDLGSGQFAISGDPNAPPITGPIAELPSALEEASRPAGTPRGQ